MSSKFGKRRREVHKGLDIRLTKYDTVVAAWGGKVRYAEFNKGGFGNLIIIRHLNGFETYYGHLSNIAVAVDQYVSAGDFIGTGGNTGTQHSVDHLHWEVRLKDKAFDPFRIIDFDNNTQIAEPVILNQDNFKKSDPKVMKRKARQAQLAELRSHRAKKHTVHKKVKHTIHKSAKPPVHKKAAQ